MERSGLKSDKRKQTADGFTMKIGAPQGLLELRVITHPIVVQKCAGFLKTRCLDMQQKLIIRCEISALNRGFPEKRQVELLLELSGNAVYYTYRVARAISMAGQNR